MRDYTVHVRWSEESEGYFATVAGFDKLSAFGKTIEVALVEIGSVLRLWEEDASNGR